MAIKGQYNPVQDIKKDQVQKFVSGLTGNNALKYYNEDLHSAAFSLPTFVKQMLNS